MVLVLHVYNPDPLRTNAVVQFQRVRKEEEVVESNDEKKKEDDQVVVA